MSDKTVRNFDAVDLTDLTFPNIVVYYNTLDYPNVYVARLFDMDKPTNVVIVKDRFEEIKKSIPRFISNKIERSHNDPKEIVCLYV